MPKNNRLMKLVGPLGPLYDHELPPGERLLQASADQGFEEPELNSYSIDLRISGIRKTEALKIAQAVRSVLDHEGHLSAAVYVSHLKFEG